MQRSILKPALAAFALAAASGSALAGELVVSAAASLTNAFREIARDYQDHNPDTKVALNFGGSGALLQQIGKGAPVDVFATADQETMDSAARRALLAAGSRRDFAANRLVVIVPGNRAAAPRQLSDLALAGVQRIAIATPDSVPVGHYSRQALQAAGLWDLVAAKAINTQHVRQTLAYVARGEVDAGFVYATDAAIMPDKVAVAFEVPLDPAIRYPIAVVADSAQPAEARRFIDYVLSPDGQAVLNRYGFTSP